MGYRFAERRRGGKSSGSLRHSAGQRLEGEDSADFEGHVEGVDVVLNGVYERIWFMCGCPGGVRDAANFKFDAVARVSDWLGKLQYLEKKRV